MEFCLGILVTYAYHGQLVRYHILISTYLSSTADSTPLMKEIEKLDG